MAEKISWTLNVAVAGGPKISSSNSLEVGAYDKVGVVVTAGSTAEVEVQPGEEGQVQFLLISADPYGSNLTYRVNDESGDPVALDGLQMFIGSGGVSLLGQSPQTFFIDNQMDTDATVEILVGRKATIGETETSEAPTDSGATEPSSATGSETDSSEDTGSTEPPAEPTDSTGADSGDDGS